MTTQQIVAYCKRKAKGLTREDILSLLNDVQEFIFGHSKIQMRFLVGTNGSPSAEDVAGFPPFLITTAGKTEYTFPDVGEPNNIYPVNVRRTAQIFVRTTTFTPYDATKFDRRALLREPFHFNGIEYEKIKVQHFDRQSGAPARIIFPFDPGDTVDFYFHLFYQWPPFLTSENVELIIPEEHHIHIREGVLSIARGEMYGDMTAWERFEDRVAKKIWWQMNKGQETLGQSPLRPEFRFGFNSVPGSRDRYDI